MIELRNNSLQFSFPDIHPDAQPTIDFQRTLRIPDDGKNYPLPPGLGRFPIKHVDDYADKVPSLWIEHGGVMLCAVAAVPTRSLCNLLEKQYG